MISTETAVIFGTAAVHFSSRRLRHLVEVQHTDGSTTRYGYRSDGTLNVVARSHGTGTVFGETGDTTVPIQANLADPASFSGQPVRSRLNPGETHRYAFSIDDAQLASTATGSVILRVTVERDASQFVAATPEIADLQPLARYVDQDQTVALFQIDRANTYDLSIRGAAPTDQGGYQLSLTIAGDINRDAIIDGLDSQLLTGAFGSLYTGSAYNPFADIDANGFVGAADRQLLAANFGFVGNSLATTFTDYFTLAAAANIIQHSPSTGSPPPSPTGVFTGNLTEPATLPTDPVTPPTYPPPTVTVEPIAPLTNLAFGITNGLFDQSVPGAPDFGWTLRGNTTIDNGSAVLAKSTAGPLTALLQPFFIPADAHFLRFALLDLSLGSAAAVVPDSFEVSFLDPNTLQPLLDPATGLADTDALLNIQPDGTMYKNPLVTIFGLDDAGGILGDTAPRIVQIDVSGLATGTLAMLTFDLLGFGSSDSRIVIDNVYFTATDLRNPVASTDIATTNEDAPLSITILANDQDAESPLDPSTIEIITSAEHGMLAIDPETGRVIYTPAGNFSGSDSFTYRVRDVDGFPSNEAPVLITVNPVADPPSLTVQPARGEQDTLIPLDITAALADTDGSETLTFELAGLPPGSTLSRGSIVDIGRWRVTSNDLDDLAIRPAAGQTTSFELSITVTATESNGVAASSTLPLNVGMDAVVADPVTLTEFTVNDGQAQRSTIHTLAVRFNQDVWIADAASDATIAPRGGGPIPVEPSRYSYDPTTWTLTIDVDGLIASDAQYELRLRHAGIASAANRAVNLSAGIEDGELPLPFHRLLADFDGNDFVDRADWDLMEPHYRTLPGHANFDATFDLDGNASIDRFDYAIWRNAVGTTTDTFRPFVLAAVSPADRGVGLHPVFQSDSNLIGAIYDSGPIASFTASVDGSPPVDVRGRLDVDNTLFISLADLFQLTGQSLSEGDHRIQLASTDRFGNTSETPEITFTIDDTPPLAPTAPVAILPGGTVFAGGRTNQTRFTIRTTADANSTVRLFRDGIELDDQLISGTTADFALSLGALGDGTYTFTSMAEDLAANRSGSSPELTLMIDTTAPTVIQFDLASESDTGTLGDRTTDLATVDLVGETEPFAQVRLLETNQILTADSGGLFQFTNVPLRFGVNTFNLEVADDLGNAATTRTTIVRPKLESTPPVVAGTLTRDTGASTLDGITSDPTITGAIGDASPITQLFAAINDGPLVDVTSGLTGGTFTLSPAILTTVAGGTLPQGPIRISIAADDLFGNRSEPVTVAFTLDTIPPSAPEMPDLIDASDTGRLSDDNLTNATSVSVVVAVEPQAGVDVRLDGDSVGQRASDQGRALATIASLTAGSHDIEAIAIDLAGNVSPVANPLTILVDLDPPELSAVTFTDPAVGTDLAAVSGQTEPFAMVNVFRNLDGAIPSFTVAANSSGRFDVFNIPVRNGSNQFRIVAVDDAGNPTELVRTIDFVAPDLSPPNISLRLKNDSGPSGDDRLTNDATIIGSVDDASPISSFQISVNGSPYIDSLGTVSEGQFTLTRSLLESIGANPLADGPQIVRVRAADTLGHSSPIVNFNFDLDTTRPTTPSPLVLSSDTGSLSDDGVTNASPLIFGTAVNSPDARIALFADGIEIDRSLSGGPAAFSVIASEGRTRYVAQSLDAAGNISFFTAPLYVTVDRSIAVPEVSLATSFISLGFGAGNHTTKAAVSLVGQADPDSAVEIIGTPYHSAADRNGRFQLNDVGLIPGANSFTVRSSDAAGNAATTVFEVTFHDLDAPTAAISLVNDTGRGTTDRRTNDPTLRAIVEDASIVTQLTASLNSGPQYDVWPSLVDDLLLIDRSLLEQVNGGSVADGRYTFALRAGDSAGNVSNSTFEFELDTTPHPANVAPDLLSGSDSGASGFDNITRVATPEIRLFAERGSVVTFYRDGRMVGQAISTGVAQFMSVPLADGAHHITATVEDFVGNFSNVTPPLSLTIDTIVPASLEFELDEASRSKVDDGHTTADSVTFTGQTEPNARVSLVGSTIKTLADAVGVFTLANVPLEVGGNTVTIVARDAAGNELQSSRSITRGELLPPVIDVQVTGAATISPTINGTVRNETPLTLFAVGFDRTNTSEFVDVRGDLVNGAFTLDRGRLERINGAPLADGDHTLYLVARDSDGLESEPTAISFTLDLGRRGTVTPQVTFLSATGVYAYQFHVAGPLDADWQVSAFNLPVPTTASISDLVTPAGWTVTHSAGSGQVQWRADDTDARIGGGEQLVFGLASDQSPAGIDAVTRSVNSSTDQQVDIPLHIRGPFTPDGPAVADFHLTGENENLVVGPSSGVLANDRGTGLSVTTTETTSLWGATVLLNPDGGFSFSPGGRFDGLSLGESIVDRFTYSVVDDLNRTGMATVEVVVHGANDPPTAVNDSPDPNYPQRYVRADSTTTIDPRSLLANDLDAEVNDRLSLVNVDAISEQGATIAVMGGQVVYDPTSVTTLNALAAGQRVTDRFAYTAVDGQGLSTTAMVEIVVRSPLNLAPSSTDDAFTIREDGEVAGDLLANDSDADRLPGDPAPQAIAESVTSALGATVIISADGTFRYDPSTVLAVQALTTGQTIQDTFVYRLVDAQGGIAAGSATLTIEGENDAPETADDDFPNIHGGQLLVVTTANGLLGNDFDVDATGALTIDLTASDTTTAGGAQITIFPDGGFEYDPAALAHLPVGGIFQDSFSYTVVDDQGLVSTATAAIEVVGVNDLPVAGEDGIRRGYWTGGDRRITIPASDGLLVNDTDVDTGARLTAVFTGTSQYGALVTVNPDGGFTYDPTGSAALRAFREAGIDVIDTFTYTVTDSVTPPVPSVPASIGEHTTSDPTARRTTSSRPVPREVGQPVAAGPDTTQATVSIIVKSGASNFDFDIVSHGYDEYGRGASINNHGRVAFQATHGDVDSIYIWDEAKGEHSLVSESMLRERLPRRGAQGDVPLARFSRAVQINDDDFVAAQRQMNVEAVTGVIIQAAPVLTYIPVTLTYAEHWNGAAALQETIELPRAVAVGDSGISASGIRWGHPLFLDFQFLFFTGTLFGVGGTSLLMQFTMQPRAWILDPTWASVYFSPVDPIWNVGQSPDDFDFDKLSGTALGLSLMPIIASAGNLFPTPVNTVYPYVSLANVENEVHNPLGKNSNYLTAFSGDFNRVLGRKTGIGIGPQGGYPNVYTEATREIVAPRVSDIGYSVFSEHEQLYIVDPELNLHTIDGFTRMGEKPSISDNGLVVFAAEHPSLGRGIYVADPFSGKWTKIAGESGDGVLDPHESDVNGLDVGALHQIDLDAQVGLNGGQGIGENTPDGAFLTATFKAVDAEGEMGLHSVRFLPAGFENGILEPRAFLGHSRVARVGEMLPGLGLIHDVDTIDAVNNAGQVVFWVDSASGEAIVRASAPLYTWGEAIYTLEGQPLRDNELLRKDDGVVVARFSSDSGGQSATIDWGDGGTSDGIVQPGEVSGVYEVIADHTYKRQGPYVITVHIAGREGREGVDGVAASLAYVVDTTNEEQIERFIPEGSRVGSRSVDRLGIRNFVEHSGGEFRVAARGQAFFEYEFGLESVNSSGDGAPNETVRRNGQLQDIDIVATGTTSGGLTTWTYQTGFSGDSRGKTTQSKREFGDSYTITTTADTDYEEHKTFDRGDFTWTYETSSESSTVRTGFRNVDRDMRGQVDGLIRQSSLDLSTSMISQSLTGAYTTSTVGSDRMIERIEESGNYAEGTVSRDYFREMNNHARTTGRHLTLDYDQEVETTSVTTVFDGNIDLDSGQYFLLIQENTVSRTIQQTERNQGVVTTTTGTTSVETIINKSGNNESGAFTLGVATETESTGTRHEMNHDPDIDKFRDTYQTTEFSRSRLTQTNRGNAKQGGYAIEGKSEAESFVTTVEENRSARAGADRMLRVESINHVVQDDKTIQQTGHLYNGEYAYHEQTIVIGPGTPEERIASVFHNEVTETNDFVCATPVEASPFRCQVGEPNHTRAISITDGGTFLVQFDFGNKVAGTFNTSDDATTATTTLVTSVNQTQQSETTTTGKVFEHSAKSGNANSGHYDYSGFRHVISQESDGVTVNDEQTAATHSTTLLDEASWLGRGDTRTGEFSRTDTFVNSAERRETVDNQTLRVVTETGSTSGGQATRTGNSITGEYKRRSFDVHGGLKTNQTRTNQTETIVSEAEEDSLTTTIQEVNLVTGAYTVESHARTFVRRQHQETYNDTLVVISDLAEQDPHAGDAHAIVAASGVGNNERMTHSFRAGNSIAGAFSSKDETDSLLTRSETSTNQTRSGQATISAASRSVVTKTGNSVTGEYDHSHTDTDSGGRRDETITNQIGHQAEITQTIETSITSAGNTTRGNDVSGFFELIDDVTNTHTDRDETISTITTGATQTVVNGLRNHLRGGLTTRTGNSVRGDFRETGFTEILESTRTNSVINQTHTSDSTTVVLFDRNDFTRIGNGVDGSFQMASTRRSSQRTQGASDNLTRHVTESIVSVDHTTFATTTGSDVTGDYDAIESAEIQQTSHEVVVNHDVRVITDVVSTTAGDFHRFGNNIVGDASEESDDVLTVTTTVEDRGIHSENTTTMTVEETLSDTDNFSNSVSGAYANHSTSETRFVTQRRESRNGAALVATSDLADIDPSAVEITQFVSAAFHPVGNNQRFAESSGIGNSITGEVTTSRERTITRLTTRETVDHVTLHSEALVSTVSEVDMIDLANTVVGEFADSDQTSRSVTVRGESTTNQTRSATSREVTSSDHHTRSSGNKISGRYDYDLNQSTSRQQIDETAVNQTETVHTTSTTEETRSTTGGGNSVSGDFDLIDVMHVDATRGETIDSAVGPITVRSSRDVHSTTTGSVSRTGNSVSGDSREQSVDVVIDSRTEDSTTNQTETTSATTVERTLTDTDKFANSNTGEYTSNTTADTTIVLLHRELRNGSLTITSDLTDPDIDAAEVGLLIASGFHPVGNNRRFASSTRSGNSITGEVLTALEQSISRTTILETTTQQTLVGTAIVSEASEMEIVDKTNSITGEFSSTDRATRSATVRNESSTNQVQTTASRSADVTESHQLKSGNAISGDYQITLDILNADTRTDRTVRNQTLTTSTTIVTSNAVSRTESGNSLTGLFNSVDVSNADTITDEFSTNHTFTRSMHVVDGTTVHTTSSGNRVTGDSTATRVSSQNSLAYDQETNQTRRTDTVSSITQDSTSDITLANSITRSESGTSHSARHAQLNKTVTNQSLSVSETVMEDSTIDSTFARNEVAGIDVASSTSTGTRTRTETLANQSLTATGQDSVTFSSSETSNTNSISGLYTTQRTATETSTHNGSDTNRGLSTTFVDTVTTNTTAADSGNSITGAYSDNMTTTRVTNRAKSDTNQSLAVAITLASTVTTTDAGTGNAILGSDVRTVTTHTVSDVSETGTNQTLVTHITRHADDTVITTTVANPITGEFTSTETTSGQSQRNESDANQTHAATITDTTTFSNQSQTSGNSVSGTSVVVSTGTSATQSQHATTNQTETVTQVDIRDTSMESSGTSNSLTGEYSSTTTIHNTFAINQSRGNQTLTVHVVHHGSNSATESETGNSITGAYSMNSTDTASSSLTEHDENQVRVVDLSATDSSSGSTAESGNRISGTYTRSTSSATTSNSTETNNTNPISAITVSSSASNTTTQTGNRIDGTFNSSATDSSTSTMTEVFSYETLTVNVTDVTSSTGETTASGNDVLGTRLSTTTSTTTTHLARSETNQTLTVTLDGLATTNTTANATANAITGEYTSVVSSSGTSTSVEESVNQSRRINISRSDSNSSTATTAGNSIIGTYSTTTSESYQNSAQETDINQTLTVRLSTNRVGSGNSTDSGNAIVGQSSFVGSESFTTTRNQTDTNQTSTISVTETTTGSTSSSGSSHSITGVYDSTNSSTTNSVLTETETNQTLTRGLTSRAHNTASSSRSGNSITGDYLSTSDSDGSLSGDETTTNQTLTVATTHSEIVSTTGTGSGNDRFRDYQDSTTMTRVVATESMTLNQTSATSATRTASEQARTTRSGNSVRGEFTESAVIDVSANLTESSTNQTLSNNSSQTETSHSQTHQTGNDITGGFTLTTSSSASVVVSDRETNTDHDITSTDNNQSTSTLSRTRNSITGAYSSQSTSTQTMSLTQSGTIGDRGFTAFENSTITTAQTGTGNEITGSVESTETVTREYNYQKNTTYPDGSDTKAVTRYGISTTRDTMNSITGVFTTDSSGSNTETVSESGNRGNAYSLHSTTVAAFVSDSSGNSITGGYSQSDTSSSDANQTRTVLDAVTGDLTLTEAIDGGSSETQSGNSITGAFTRSSSSSSTITTDQTSTSADDSTSLTVHSVAGWSLTAMGTGNSVTGAVSETTNRTRTESITQTGQVGATTIAYSSNTADTSQLTTTGNVVLGELATTGTGVETYSFTQEITSAAMSYTLTGSGTKSYARSDIDNTITGAYTQQTTGTDDYVLTQSGMDGGGSFEITVDGSDGFTTTETGNTQTGGFERTTTGTGTADRAETRGGSTQTETVTLGYTLHQSGNYLDGLLAQTVTGSHRYTQLAAFLDTSNSAIGTPGVVDFALVGAPLTVGAGPAVPTGGGISPVSATAVDSIFSRAASALGSLIDPLVRGPETAGYLSLVSGHDLSYAATLAAFSDLGSELLYEYCFAAGTRILMADGSTRPIERIEPGEQVLSVPDSDPLSWPEARAVVEVYHNAPARLLRLRFGDEVIRATFQHPFYLRDRGWVHSAQLRVGDQVRTHDRQWRVLTDVFDHGEIEPVFNLHIDGHHTYFVALGDGGSALVHNFSLAEMEKALQWGFAKFDQGLDVLVDFADDHGSEIRAAWNAIDEETKWFVAIAVSTGLVVAGVSLAIVSGGAALPISLMLIGMGINSAIQGGLFEGKFDPVGYFSGMGMGALAGLALGVSVVGTTMGGVSAALQVYAGNPEADAWDYGVAITTGMVFGAINPTGASLGLVGAELGGIAAVSLGYDWRQGVQIGGLVGDIAGTGLAAFGRGGSVGYAVAAMAPEVAMGGAGFYLGYTGPHGSFERGMMYANIGTMLGGITSAKFVKCFVGGTSVVLPIAEDEPMLNNAILFAASAFEGDLVEDDKARMAWAAGSILVGAALSFGAHFVRRGRNSRDDKNSMEVAADLLFGQLGWE